jgi:putative hydrolase of the HAD superfamily
LLDLTAFDALSFDCYGTLIDWEAGLGTVLDAWPGVPGVGLTREGAARPLRRVETQGQRAPPSPSIR